MPKPAPETFDQYTRRILSYADGDDPREIIRRTPARLSRRVNAATRRRLTARPAPGKWSVGEILSHLSEVEMLWGYRIRAVYERSGIPLVGMDQDAWAKNSRYRRIDPRRALETFVAIRRANVEFIDGIRRTELKRWGRHSQFGRLTLAKMIALMAGHDLNHTRQVEARLSGRRRGAARG
ncbi:MAG TPA: DinB family protein [Thermoanaerobaculia bacterium]|nr:DinB family protein [Thermoanaerobaculia bacterium]